MPRGTSQCSRVPRGQQRYRSGDPRHTALDQHASTLLNAGGSTTVLRGEARPGYQNHRVPPYSAMYSTGLQHGHCHRPFATPRPHSRGALALVARLQKEIVEHKPRHAGAAGMAQEEGSHGKLFHGLLREAGHFAPAIFTSTWKYNFTSTWK